jgi:hypothetical protein
VALLSSRWQLHDVDDVEGLLRKAIADSGTALTPHDLDDLLGELFEFAWKLAAKYDPGRGSFSTFLYGSVRRQGISAWLRRPLERTGRTGFTGGRTVWRFGGERVHERRPRQFVSFDGGDSDGLDAALGTGAGDPPIGSGSACDGLLVSGDRQRARDLRTLGLKAPRRVA